MVEAFAHDARKASLGQERTRNLAVSRRRGYEQDAILFTLYVWIQSVFFRSTYDWFLLCLQFNENPRHNASELGERLAQMNAFLVEAQFPDAFFVRSTCFFTTEMAFLTFPAYSK